MATENQIKYWNSLRGRKLSEETCKRMSDSHKGIIPKNCWKEGHELFTGKGEKSANWKGGVSRKYGLSIIQKLYCQGCGTEERKLHLHHKDHNPKNNELSNLVVLCSKCHIGMHNRLRERQNNLNMKQEIK